MALKQMIVQSLSLISLFQGVRADQCDPKPMIIRHEGEKACVYLDTKGIKTIGVGYNMQNKDAPEVFDSIGADYNKFESGPVTRWNVPCNCSSVPCLTEDQIEELLDISLKTAIADARKVITTFDGLCCSVQNVMVDMSFTLGGPGFAQFTTFADLLTRQYWKAAGDDLTVSLWCKQATSRCMEDANYVREGCGCSQPYPQACDSQASGCCGSKEQQTCCKDPLQQEDPVLLFCHGYPCKNNYGYKGTLTFKGQTFEEQLCCPHPSATCCQHNKCCTEAIYTVCCPPPPAVPTYCCTADFPVCKDGQCYRACDNQVIEGKPTAQALPLP